MNQHFNETQIIKNVDKLNQKFSSLTKKWDQTLNSQWVVRDYLAVKMILSSSVFLNSARFANQKNIRIVEPYLIYYALLNCSRAVLFTSPDSEWKSGELFKMTHQKTINVVGDLISKYDKIKGKKIKGQIDWAREYREIFSYRFPASGLPEDSLSICETIHICQLLCELAQFQSKALENSITKNAHEPFILDHDILTICEQYGEKNFQFWDGEDGYRLNYIIRKQKRPYSLHLTMTEGLVEDFFGAWYPKGDTNLDCLFDPNRNTQIIFPVP